MNLRDVYHGKWEKAAQETKLVMQDLIQWFPKLEFRAGKGALSDQEVNEDHTPGEPDIFLDFKGETLAGIEVTGSDKVCWPCAVWIGKHKVDHAFSVGYPTAFALFYPGNRRFITARMVRHYAPIPETLTPYGLPESYHVLKPHHTMRYGGLKPWLERLVEMGAE